MDLIIFFNSHHSTIRQQQF